MSESGFPDFLEFSSVNLTNIAGIVHCCGKIPADRKSFEIIKTLAIRRLQKDTAYLTYALQGQTLLRIMSKLDALESEFQTCACKRIRKSQHKEPSHTDFVIELNRKTFIWCFWFSTIQYFQGIGINPF